MIDTILCYAGVCTARVTTLGFYFRGSRIAPSTDASRREVYTRLDEATAAGAEVVVVEAFSRMLAQGFAEAWRPHFGVLTQVTRDHVDAHGTLAEYEQSKARLLMSLCAGHTAVLNRADPVSMGLAQPMCEHASKRTFSSDAHTDANLTALAAASSLEGTTVELAPSPLAARLGGRLRLRTLGAPFVANALAAAVCADALGVEGTDIAGGLAAFAPLPGRFEIMGRQPLVVVDYGHTAAALAGTLNTARALVSGQVAVVFGCGGNTDRGKRPLMGLAAAQHANRVFLTNDNARDEPAEQIASDILSGVNAAPGHLPAHWSWQPDRQRAIVEAIETADSSDAVVIAGRGHEAELVVGSSRIPVSDVDVARASCARLQ